MQHPVFYCPTRIHSGSGVHGQVGTACAQFAAKSVLVVVDEALLDTPIYAGVGAALDAAGMRWTSFSDVEQNPSDLTVLRAVETCRSQEATTLVALGGGSAIDVAKAVAILMTNGGTVQDYEGMRKFDVRPLPLIAIPTTAGTGSEVSGSCVITDSRRDLKMSLRHPELNPADIALLDPLAVSTLPAHVAMHSGMDAFVHAFESYISLGANPMTDAVNLHALDLISRSLLPFIAHRGNEAAALDMLYGSTLTGMVFGITGLGNVHCMSRFIGAYYHLSHGYSNALCLPHVAAFNRIAVPQKFARLARVFGCHRPGMSDDEASREAVAYIQQLCQDAGVPPRLRDAGVKDDAFDEISALCVEAGYHRWNPRLTSRRDFQGLLERAF